MPRILADYLKPLHHKTRLHSIGMFLAMTAKCDSLLDLGGVTVIDMELPLYRACREVRAVTLSIPLLAHLHVGGSCDGVRRQPQ